MSGITQLNFLEEEDGAKIIAIIERDGAIINESGLPVEEVSVYKKENGKVEGFPNAKFEPNGAKIVTLPFAIF